MEGVQRPPLVLRLPSPVYGLTALAVVVVTPVLLDVGARPGGAAPASGVGGPVAAANVVAFNIAWLAWRVVAGVAVVLFLFALVSGFVVLARSVRTGVLPAGPRWVAGYLVAPAILVATVIIVLVGGGGQNPDLPINHLAWRTRTVLFVGLASSVPWVALAWLCQDRARPGPYRPWGVDDGELDFEDLSRLWRLITTCIGAFAAGVTAAVLTSGALRFAFLAARPQCGAGYAPPPGGPRLVCVLGFPAVNVLLYGAAFAVFGLAFTVPLIATWRASALGWVERQRPATASGEDAAWVTERSRLFALVHLDTPVLRNPLTLLSVFTPLITSTLAAFLPQLGS